ncbi:NAD(P)-binding protein [Serendipita vermifera]|nr:NAD(P)-binding protein [Serendipita vermifera]
MSAAPSTAHHLSSASLYDLSGLVALVTGGGSGIGLMIAEAYAANGAKVYIAGRRLPTLEKAASDVAMPVVSVVLDVTDKASIRECVKTIESKEGKLHILVNNAGQVGPYSMFWRDPSTPEHADIGKSMFENETFDEWSSLFNINLTSIYFTTFAFLTLLEKGAEDLKSRFSFKPTTSVINITSVSGIQRQAQCHFAYNISKAGANHLTRLFSTELALKDKPIRVNAIAPGPFATEMTQLQGWVDERIVDLIGRGVMPHPAKRGGREEEIGAAALLLGSPSAGGYINGQILGVEGGFLLVNPGST